MTPNPQDLITQGTMRTTSGEVLPLLSTEVSGQIDGPVASVTLVQHFRNTTSNPIEAEYLFPLPHEASVFSMRFRIGDRTVEAAIKEKEEAKRAYAAARREGRAATLLEQERPSLFTLSVANIPAGQEIVVTLVYQEMLAFDEGEWRFVFPMVTAERYHGGKPDERVPQASGSIATDEVPDAAKIRPPRAATGERKADIRLSLLVRPGVLIEPPRSLSHRIDIDPLSEGAFSIKLHESETIPNRDFVLAFRAAPGAGVRPKAYFYRQPDKMGTFLLVVTPPIAPIEDLSLAERGPAGDHRTFRCNNCGGVLRDASTVKEWPGLGPAWKCEYCGAVVAAKAELAKVGLPRDVVFLVDRSCSMRGQTLPTARRAVRLMLEHLGPEDRVQLFAFDHDRIAFDGSGSKWASLDKATVNAIDEFLRTLTARGGTELEEALIRASQLATEPGRSRLVVLLSDGAVGNEGRLFRRAPEILGKETRLYVLGVGPSVNRFLVERLARAAGGASDVLLPGEDVEIVAGRFARRVRQAGPVLTDIRLSWDDAMPVDVYPSPAPELFGGQTVQLLGRFAGEGKSKLVLTGKRATGEPFRQEVEVLLPEKAEDVPALERLWARLRIDARLARLNEAPQEAGDVRMEVLGLALKHKLLSPYTALIAEDSEKIVTTEAKKVQLTASAEASEPEEEGAEEEEGEEEEGALGFADGGVDALRSMPMEGMSMTRAGTLRGAVRSLSAHAIGGAGRASPAARRSEAEAPATGAPPPPAAAPIAPPMAFGAPPSASPRPMSPGAPMPVPASSSVFIPGAAPPEPELAKAKGGGGFFAKVKEAFGFGKADEAKPEPIVEEHRMRSISLGERESLGGDESAESLDLPAEEPTEMPKSPEPSADDEVAPLWDAQSPQSPKAPPPEVPDSESYTEEMLARVKDAAIGELDLVFLVDETGSMGAYIDEVKRRLMEIIAALQNAPLCRSMRIGIVSYRDHPPQERTFASRVVPLSSNIAEIKAGVSRMTASGGGDGPESVTDGLYDLVRMEWRPRAARVVVWVGDAPPHGVEPSGDGFPQGCPCGHHWYAQAENAREMGIVIHAVGCLPTLRAYVGAEDVFKTVAKTTRGLYLPLEKANLLIGLITGVAETELDKQRIEEHIAEVLKKYEKVLTPADPQEQVRFVTDVLRQEQVRPRSIVYDPRKPGPAPQRFREIEPSDVEEGIERLRRVLRTAL